MSERVIEKEAMVPLTTADLDALLESFQRMLTPTADRDRLERIEALERLKSGAAAAQAHLTATLATSLRATPRTTAAGIGAQVGLARHTSPAQGARDVRFAEALTRDLPHTYAALAQGDLSEERARIIATETEGLTAEDRRRADEELSGRCARLGDKELREATRRIVLRLDHDAAAARAKKAHADRHVRGRMLADGMAQITALVGAPDYAAAMTALRARAASAKAAGDQRRPGQIKADHLINALSDTGATSGSAGTGTGTGTNHAGANPEVVRVPGPVPVMVNLVIGVETLFGDGPEPGYVPGLGHLPAALCRDWVLRGTQNGRAKLRRLFVTPTDRELVAMESRSRTFDGQLGQFIDIRDGGTCPNPWCDNPIRHRDHVQPHRQGGPTTADNGQGLCETCNQIKEEHGWTHWASRPDEPHEVGFLTPLGDHHSTRPPPQPGGPQGATLGIPGEIYVCGFDLIA